MTQPGRRVLAPSEMPNTANDVRDAAPRGARRTPRGPAAHKKNARVYGGARPKALFDIPTALWSAMAAMRCVVCVRDVDKARPPGDLEHEDDLRYSAGAIF